MPKRTDLRKILLIGSGPIVIGQACEFDYSGTQACKALREEGYVVVLVNSNPATIMTDPGIADRTYIEPISWEIVAKIIERERPDALLPTLGGQTGLNTAMDLEHHGVLKQYGVEMIGARAEVIDKAEDRAKFKQAMIKIGLAVPRSAVARTLGDAQSIRDEVGLPCVIRPSFTLGGTGGGIAYNREEFNELVARGLDLSPVTEVLIEESVIGWKEFELEVMRDRADNVVIVCSIENLDPMGVHTGDSITVAPAQTLTDKEYQQMRDAAIRVIREIGVELERELRAIHDLQAVTDDLCWRAKQAGFSDKQLANLWNATEMEVRRLRKARGKSEKGSGLVFRVGSVTPSGQRPAKNQT